MEHNQEGNIIMILRIISVIYLFIIKVRKYIVLHLFLLLENMQKVYLVRNMCFNICINKINKLKHQLLRVRRCAYIRLGKVFPNFLRNSIILKDPISNVIG